MNLLRVRYRGRFATAFVTILVFFALLVFYHDFLPAATDSFPKEGIVAEVIDGDTIVLSTGQTVRYLGINAPEVRVRQGKKWVFRPQPFGQEATDCNRNLVQGKWVYLEYDIRKRDDYGRLLAFIREGDLLVNAELVKRGLALVDIRKPNYQYQETLLSAQQEARSRCEGMWSELSGYLVDADQASGHIGELAMVHGQITGIRSSKGKLILYFGQKGQTGFSAIVYREHLKHFSFPAQDVGAFLRSKQANIYGFIKSINGPAIVMCAPTQIDVFE